MSSVDLLAIVAHPDDAEISAAGTLIRHRAAGYSTGIVDLTRGELGTRGSAQIRDKEAAAASTVLGLAVRENLELPDGFFRNDPESVDRVIRCIRRLRPRVVLTNALHDRHPDHGRAAELVREACFYSGLVKIETGQDPWRPQAVYHLIQDYYHEPSFVVDISGLWEKKIEVLSCFSTQFFNPDSAEPETPISGKQFFEFLKSRAITLGRPAGFEMAEGFVAARVAGVEDMFQLR